VGRSTIDTRSEMAGPTREVVGGRGVDEANAGNVSGVGNASSAGINSATAMAPTHTTCLAAADDRRSASVASHAAPQMPRIRSDAVIKIASAPAICLSPFLPCPLDHVGEPLPILARHRLRVFVDQRSNRLGGGPFEDGVH